MKKFILAIAAPVLLFSCTMAQNKQFSKDAISQKLTALDGNQVEFGQILEKHKGNVTVIEIWASWCGDCVKAMPKLKDLQSRHPEVEYVFISMDKEMDKWKSGIEKHDLKGDQYWATDGMKGKFGYSINLDWIARYIIIDKDGKVVTYRAIETDFDQMDKTLKSL